MALREKIMADNIILVETTSPEEEKRLMEGFFNHNSYDKTFEDGELPDDGESDDD